MVAMIRRRRTQREIPFSFDSFLDVVANVVGIILRLILVAWVGGRSYHPTVTAAPPSIVQEETADATETPLPPDPLADNLDRHRRELTADRDRLADQVHQADEAKERRLLSDQALADAAARLQTLQAERTAAERSATDDGKDVKTAALSLPEIESRVRLVNAEIDGVKKSPSVKRSLRYQTPVSQPLQTEELFFECHAGRITLIDVGAMLEQVRRERDEKAKLLATQWQVEGMTGSVGAFRMHYMLERERGVVDGPGGGGPLPDTQFSYSIGWTAEPINGDRGETGDAALAAGSEFRRVVDGIDPKVTAVTIWVYADSFSLYRRLRDYLHDRDFVVAGRPLLEGMPIGSSRHGTASRGQ
jgi:hypothetical protein